MFSEVCINQVSESIESILLLEMSRRNTDSVVGLLEQKPAIFPDLFNIFIRLEEPVSRRAAWALDIYSEAHPAELAPYLDFIIDKLF